MMPSLLLADVVTYRPRVVDLWPIAVPVILGLIAVYLLLPRARSFSALWGSLCAALALVAGGFWLTRAQAVHPETILFYAFAAIAILSGGLLITQRNPVRAALSFALVVLSTCGLFLLQAAPFLMAATIIVYAGAIVVTFLFVIMLAQQAGQSDADHRSREPELSCFAGFLLLGALLFLLRLTYDTRTLDALLDQTDRALAEVNGVLERTEPNAANPPPTPRQIRAALARIEWDSLFKGLDREVQQRGGPNRDEKYPELADFAAAITEAQSNWNGLAGILERKLRPIDGAAPQPLGADGRKSLEETRQALVRLRATGDPFRETYGSLRADPVVGRLPADNVAQLGQALFTNYLIPVELGGTLLLVATIGAIAIAGRRAEGLR